MPMQPDFKRDYSRDFQHRPARRQLAERQVLTQGEGQGQFNIFYSKYQSEGKPILKRGVDPASTRCVIERDAGRTLAKFPPFCIHFAHGKCIHGKNCQFLHRIPLDSDEFETTYDCFGRDKHRNQRDDMGGVGSFENRISCLYVGGVEINDYMEIIVRKHFSEWGEIDYINVLQPKGVVFVRYKNLANAEFAKEAMHGQLLEGGRPINVRWANDDPNPAAIEHVKRKAEEAVFEGIKKSLPKIGELGTILDYENAYKYPRHHHAIKSNPDSKKESITNGNVAHIGRATSSSIPSSQSVSVNSAYIVPEIKAQPSAIAGLLSYESSDDD